MVEPEASLFHEDGLTLHNAKDETSILSERKLENWDRKLEYNEVEARIYKHLKHFDVDLNSFNMKKNFEELKFDWY